jgi:6,7-dimethyl-8-ribityllumazine synthase
MPTLTGKAQTKPFPIAIVVSTFNEEITEKLLEGARSRLSSLGFSDDQVTVLRVPGAVEIPLAAQKIAQLGIVEAVVTLGAVIRGETSHYDTVCQMVSQGCQQVSLQNDLPVIFGVLTVETEAQALDRLGGNHGHKGIDAVDAACEMVQLFKQLPAHV